MGSSPTASENDDESSSDMQANHSSIRVLLDDDPCWGSPTRCRLEDLLPCIDKRTAILRETDDYLVLDKPPDLRMDGCYRATVHKLLTYWYTCTPPSFALYETKHLLQTIQQNLHLFNQQHHLNSISNACTQRRNMLRPCHQLDYATSGCLVVARTAEAARLAGDAQSRRAAGVSKHYLAVVHGHVAVAAVSPAATTTNTNTTTTDCWPITLKTQQELRDTFGRVEASYRRTRRASKKRSDTFVGYLPSHAVFVQWKQQRLQQVSSLSSSRPRQQQQSSKKTKHSRQKRNTQQVWKDLVLDLPVDEKKQLVLLSWSDVKRNSSWKQAFQTLTDRYNHRLRQFLVQEKEELSNAKNELPRLFRIEGEDANGEEAFYICAPVAQVPRQFAVRVMQPSAQSSSSSSFSLQDSNNDSDSDNALDYKPSLTRCVILHRGILDDDDNNDDNRRIPVTKVRLEPKTGRRHQLRVHMAHVAGHAIVGDVTYHHDNDGNNNNITRMCLHAHQISLPPLFEDTITAPDPFPVHPETGRVRVQNFV